MGSHRPENRVQNTYCVESEGQGFQGEMTKPSVSFGLCPLPPEMLPHPTDSRKSWKCTTTTPHHAGLSHRQAVLKHSHLAWVGELLGCTLFPESWKGGGGLRLKPPSAQL